MNDNHLEDHRRAIEREVLDAEVVEQRSHRSLYRERALPFHAPERAIIEVWSESPGGDIEYRVDLAELAKIRPGTPEFCAKYIPPPDPEMRIVGGGRGGLIVESELGERFRANNAGLEPARRRR